MKFLICFWSVLFLVLTVNIPASHAQEPPVDAEEPAPSYVPEGATARLGKGKIDEIAYSPDGSVLAVGAGPSIWFYETVNYQEIDHLVVSTHARVSSIAFSPNGLWLASGSGGVVHLWDAGSRTLIDTLSGHNDRVLSVAFSPDSRKLASGSGDRTVILWEVETATRLHTLTAHTSRVNSVAFSPDGEMLASGSGDSRVILWDVETATQIATLPTDPELEGQVQGLAFSPDGETLAAANDFSIVYLWDVETATQIATLPIDSWTLSVAFVDGKTLAIGGHRRVYLWDVETATQIATLGGHTRGVRSVAFNPNGETLASASEDEVHLWNFETDTPVVTLTGYTSAVNGIAFATDGFTLASASWGGAVHLWDIETAANLNTLKHKGQVYNVAFSPDGFTLASGSWYEVLLWDAWGGTLLNTLEHPRGVRGVAFSPDGQRLASGSENGEIRLWDTWDGTLLHTLKHDDWVRSVAFSPDSQTLASASSDQTVRLWDVGAGTLVGTFEHERSVRSVTFSPDGETLASASSDGLYLWDIETATSQTLDTFTARCVAFSPDGETLAAGSYNAVHLFDVESSTHLDRFVHNDWVESVAFSLNGEIIASGSEDGTVILWQLTSPSGTITFNPSTIADQVFTVDSPVNLTLPTATGGTPPYTYTLSPIPDGLNFDETTQALTGTPTTPGITYLTYTATDATAASADLEFSIEVVEEGIVVPPPDVDADVDGDGRVTVIDLAIVALFYGTQVPSGIYFPADVNDDGSIDLADLIVVAEAIDAAGTAGTLSTDNVEIVLETVAEQVDAIAAVPEAPARISTSQHARLSGIAARNVAAAFADAKPLATDNARLGKWMPMLQELQHLLTEMAEVPETTALLPNYPNPFNPETWIPYHLSKDAEVILTIYDVHGVAVRKLTLGHQPAGVYESRGRAAYWDGKNRLGEPVASGLYFYTLTAGDFTATRKMLIAK